MADIGWFSEGLGEGGPTSAPPVSTNSGVWDDLFTYNPVLGAGVVDYVGGTVVWSTVWTPVGADEPPPTNFPNGENGDVIQIAPPPFAFPVGVLEITATLDGVPCTNGPLTLAISPGGAYGSFAWDNGSGGGGGGGDTCVLPELLAPAGTPVFLENGHSQNLRSVYRDVPMGTGHMCRIRTRTRGKRIASVSWFVNANKVQAIEAWHEGSLRAGVEPFSARIARIGGRGLTWWKATWVGPLVYTPLSATQWRVNGDLLLSCGGGLDGPISTSARVEFQMALRATASAVITAYAAVEFVAELEQKFVGPTLRKTTSGELRVTTSGQTRITR